MKTQRVSYHAHNGTASALWARTRDRIGYETKEINMTKIRQAKETEEPIGIIISRGDPAERRPIFSAYIWAPAPELPIEVTAKVA